jgi:glycosyltransferase involved in cell wall biosynthesis
MIPRCILFYSYSWYPKVDGVTIRYDGIMRNLLASGHSVIMCVPERPGSGSPTPAWFQTHPRCVLVTVPSRRMPDLLYPESSVYLADPLRIRQVQAILESLVRTHQVDLIHVTLPDAVILPVVHLITSTYHIPLVGMYHTDVYNYLPSRIIRAGFYLVQRLQRFEWLSCLVVPSKIMQQALVTQGFTGTLTNSYVIPPCVDTTLFSVTTPTKKSYWSAGSIRLLYVGRVEREKSIERILYAMDATMCLIVVGMGSQCTELARLSHHLGIDVRFMGALSQEELASWYCSTDFFIMPSGTETLGFTTIESMVCGACTLGFAAGGTLDLIQDHQTGLLWSSSKELKTLIIETYPRTEYRKQVCHEARNACADYTIDNSVAALVCIYERMMDEMPIQSTLRHAYRWVYCHILLTAMYIVYSIINVYEVVVAWRPWII